MDSRPLPIRHSVFISYSHRDREWLDRLNVHLCPLVRDRALDIWDDTKIAPGSKWKEEIKTAIAAAKVAILLVSADFLASDFVATDELPPLLAAARDDGAVILPLILSPSRFLRTPLAGFQAVNDPSRPLIALPRFEQEDILVRATEAVERAMQSNSSPQESATTRILDVARPGTPVPENREKTAFDAGVPLPPAPGRSPGMSQSVLSSAVAQRPVVASVGKRWPVHKRLIGAPLLVLIIIGIYVVWSVSHHSAQQAQRSDNTKAARLPVPTDSPATEHPDPGDESKPARNPAKTSDNAQQANPPASTKSPASGHSLDVQPPRNLTGHSDNVWSVAFSPDSRILASGSKDNTVKLWDVVTAPEVRTLKGHTEGVCSVAFSADARWLASGSHDKTIKVWNVAAGNEVRTLRGSTEPVCSVAFSPDGRWLASGSWDHTITLWDVASWGEVRTLTDTDAVNGVAFSPDSRWLASADNDFTIKLWDVASGQEARTLTGHTDAVYSVAFGRGGRLLASGSRDNTIRLWNLSSGQWTRALTGHTEAVDSVAFSPDSRWLASGSDTIKLWDVASGQEVRTLTGVGTVAFSPDGHWLASVLDHTVKLWRLKD